MTGRALAFLLAITMAGTTIASAGGPHATDSRNVKAVVELFTSQGCSSCPPADRLLGKLSHDPAIVALAYHVDYWNYIGWDDPLATRANTDRQRAYSRALGSGTIYTPQVIVNGEHDLIGSSEDEIRKVLKKSALDDEESGIAITLSLRDDRLQISAEGPLSPPAGRTSVLMLITYDEAVETKVEKGENKGLVLLDTHAVRDWRILGMWDGTSMKVDIPTASLQGPAGRKGGCAAVLQSVTASGAPGPILAAAAIDF